LKKQSESLYASLPDELSEVVFKNILEEVNGIAAVQKTLDTLSLETADRIISSTGKALGDFLGSLFSAVLYPVKASISAILNY